MNSKFVVRRYPCQEASSLNVERRMATTRLVSWFCGFPYPYATRLSRVNLNHCFNPILMKFVR